MSEKMREALIDALEVGSHLMSAASYARAKEALAEQPAQGENDDGLLPCPFCGSREVSLSIGAKRDGSPWPYIECHSCAASAEPGVWNRRAEQPAHGEAVAWTLIFNGRKEINTQTTFSTESKANEYADRCAAQDPCAPQGLPRPRVVPLYTAPPAPSVPEARPYPAATAAMSQFNGGWNACRTAILETLAPEVKS